MKLLLPLLLLFAGSFSAVTAQTTSSPANQVDPFIREHKERQAKNPEGLLFKVRLKENGKQFHLGEIISLELSFAASKPETLTLDAATYDRSGRLHSDGFVLDQQDAAPDPIEDYFQSGLDFFMLGGLRGIPDLTDKPYLITEELNEWRRIDRPGHYRLYVVTSRVGRKGGRGVFLANSDSHAVSNVIEFDVVPADKKWASQKLNESVTALSKVGGDRNSACRALRFLGTAAAVTEMRKRFRGDDRKCEWEYKFGLIGSPHRNLVIREMENAISLPEQPVTSHFISTLALLEFIKRAPARPPYPENDSEEQFKQWQTQNNRRRSLYDELRLNYLRQLVIAIPQKQRQARATSLQTLLDFRSELNSREVTQWSSLLASLPEVFSLLPQDDQSRLLQYQWKPIASPAMLPVLRRILKYSYKTPNKVSPDDLFDGFDQENLRSIALKRIFELAPGEGRTLILEELRRPKLRVNEDVLMSLPDEVLPELNIVLLSKLEELRRSGGYTEDISELIERYATDEILSGVRAVYEGREVGKWDCRSQAALLAYLGRVAPSLSGEYLSKALAARAKGWPRCFTEVLKNVAKLHMSPELEDVATAALDDDDAQVVSQAAGVLAEYGSADAEKALWRRFEKLHTTMESRGEEPVEGSDEEDIEKALGEALTKGQAWLSDPDKLKQVRELCFTDKCRAEVDSLITGWDPQIYVAFTWADEGPSRIGVAHYRIKSLDSLKEKLLQFPKGSVFKLKTDGDEAKAEEVFQQIKSYLEENGMKLKRVLEQ
jgi:hypothetical protein